MDSVSIIVTAMALGAANGLKDVVEETITDLYTAIKQTIRSRYSTVNVNVLEKNPQSEFRQAVLEEDLTEAGVEQDEDLLEQARLLIESARTTLPDETIASVGVEIREVQGGNLTIRRIHSQGKGVVITGSQFGGDLAITDVDVVDSNWEEIKKNKG